MARSSSQTGPILPPPPSYSQAVGGSHFTPVHNAYGYLASTPRSHGQLTPSSSAPPSYYEAIGVSPPRIQSNPVAELAIPSSTDVSSRASSAQITRFNCNQAHFIETTETERTDCFCVACTILCHVCCCLCCVFCCMVIRCKS